MIFTAISTAPKNKVNAAHLIYIRTGCKIRILSENKLIYTYMLIKELGYLAKYFGPNFKIRSESVFGPNCRRAAESNTRQANRCRL